ncbi:hypothetical protein SLS53_003257 [Cytospora paraplurivora]|uniref:Heterokaryon incompatibility domain-containing protein n=1 Tax=Cytospora paraplurivora TaxID=2898453 RepID=A0AAN9YJE7_9PEZI
MWLINTSTLLLESVPGPESQPYAILSHTWEKGEVSFQQIANLDEAQKMKGFQKIAKTCELAQKQDPPLQYAWIDTCCIDKLSSAELAESINSMFAWYKKATVCFVFLSDLPAHEPESWDPILPLCRWFTRGWTLQELIAPKLVEFYDCEWNCHGTKSQRMYELEHITGVDAKVLGNSNLLSTICVGARMSWAAGRQTTRQEDMAYCLLGIFDVNMTMIYGEGGKAFIRLQEQIIKDSNDMTLFAWTSDGSGQVYRGLLARSPSEFRACRNLRRLGNSSTLNRDYMLTNNGLRIQICLASASIGTSEKDYILGLGSSRVTGELIGIHLTKTPNGFVRRLPGQFFREEEYYATGAGEQSITYIRKDVTPEESGRLDTHLRRKIKVTLDLPRDFELASLEVQPSALWDQYNLTLMLGDDAHADYFRFLSVGLRDKSTGTLAYFAIICKLVDLSSLVGGEPRVIWYFSLPLSFPVQPLCKQSQSQPQPAWLKRLHLAVCLGGEVIP